MLYLDDNNLRGEIPNELARMTELTGLLLVAQGPDRRDSRRFSFVCVKLTHLSLYANDSRGEVPPVALRSTVGPCGSSS